MVIMVMVMIFPPVIVSIILLLKYGMNYDNHDHNKNNHTDHDKTNNNISRSIINHIKRITATMMIIKLVSAMRNI